MPSCIAQALTKCRCPLEPDSSPRISQEIRATRVGMYRPLAFDAVGAGCPDDQKGTGNSRPCRRTLPTAPAGRPQPREIQWNGNARNPNKRDHAISSRRKPAKFLLSEICHQGSRWLTTVPSPVPGEPWVWWGLKVEQWPPPSASEHCFG